MRNKLHLVMFVAAAFMSFGCATDPSTGSNSVDWGKVAADSDNFGKILCVVNGIAKVVDPALAVANQELDGVADRVCALIGGAAAPAQPPSTGVVQTK